MQNSTASNKIIAFKQVNKVYEPSQEVALHNVSFEVKKGEFVCLIGPSGCGKSTVLKIIAGLEKESSGSVVHPENIAMVFQSGSLLPWFSVFENIAIGLRAIGKKEAEVRRNATRYMAMMNLSPFADKFPRELSGGQRQRVGIARALAVIPQVLLLDEPFSSLDAKTTEELHHDILRIWQETGITIVMVSHLIEEAVSLAGRVILMKKFTIAHEFAVDLARPRREQALGFSHIILGIRREFFK